MVDKAITLSDKPRKHHHTLKTMEPVEQVDPESYIGLAFKQLDKKKRHTDKKHCKRSILSDVSSNSLGDSSGSSLSEDDGLNNSDNHSSDSSSSSTSSSGMRLSSASSTSHSSK